MTKVAVIGGGIAGVAAAAFLSRQADVTLFESERVLAYHTTGRSAATFLVNYGGKASRPLAAASRSFFLHPPDGTTDGPLLAPRGAMWIAPNDRLELIRSLAAEGEASGADIEILDGVGTRRIVPALRQDRVAGALLERSAMDIDVAGLHQAFVRIARRNSTEIVTSAPVTGLENRGTWNVIAEGTRFECDVVINAAGAWGDEVAALAGIPPVGLTPMRRTAFMVPASEESSAWPLVVEIDDKFYFRPDGTQLLCSLAEETPAEPGDPKPRMEDVALAIQRINDTTTLNIRTVNSQWTGLRTFAPDRELVIGEDPTAPGFFWLVGQGGIGIMTSPAYGQLIASQVMGKDTPQPLVEAGVNPVVMLPRRFRT